MNIIVCVKHVADTTEIRIDKKTGELVLRGIPTKINDYDRNAIHEAVRLKKETGGSITLLCVGPREAGKTLKEGLAMGADRAFLIAVPAAAYTDPQHTAKVLAAGIEKIDDYDLVICGDVTEDGYNSQVGPAIAQRLGIAHVSYVVSLQIPEQNSLVLERTLKDQIEKIAVKTPALISVNSRINIPRLPTTLQVMKVPSNKITEWKLTDVGLDNDELEKTLTFMRSYRVPVTKRKNIIIEGPPKEAAGYIVNYLKEEGVL